MVSSSALRTSFRQLSTLSPKALRCPSNRGKTTAGATAGATATLSQGHERAAVRCKPRRVGKRKPQPSRSTPKLLPPRTKGSSLGAGLPRPARDTSFSSRPAASSSAAGVAAHAGGAEAAEHWPRCRPPTAGLHQFGPPRRRAAGGRLCPKAGILRRTISPHRMAPLAAEQQRGRRTTCANVHAIPAARQLASRAAPFGRIRSSGATLIGADRRDWKVAEAQAPRDRHRDRSDRPPGRPPSVECSHGRRPAVAAA